MKAFDIMKQFMNYEHDTLIEDLYEDKSLLVYQRARYVKTLERFIKLYGDNDIEIYSVAGRSEVGGNHTDHQHGCVLAASINLDAIAMVMPQDDVIEVVSDNFNIEKINIHELSKKDNELGTSEALIRGVVYKLKELGYKVGGFKAVITSDVLMGAGLSSSAAVRVR